MLLNEWLTIDLFSNISYIEDNESKAKDFLYHYIYANYGKKETSTLVDAFSDKLDTIGNILDTIFRDKWKTLKEALTTDIGITGIKDIVTEQIDNSIYGFNGDSAKDYTQTKTTTKESEFDDIYEKIKTNVEMREMLSYYKNVAEDIGTMLTTPIYTEGR